MTMTNQDLTQYTEEVLHRLCVDIPTRPVGSTGNQRATDTVAGEFKACGFQVECPEFECLDWETQGASCKVKDTAYQVFPSPYGLGCKLTAPLVTASNQDELIALDFSGRVLMLSGELTKEQLMPKNFPFYRPEEHQRLIQILEDGKPAAILTATTRNPELVGGIYPFPLIEDGDFQIPVGYMTAEEGEQFGKQVGEMVQLEICSRRIPAKGCNVIARTGPTQGKRVVLTAHIDSKQTTPGALDNAAGVTVLLLLAKQLKEAPEDVGTELFVVNGEDYYGANGEIQYLNNHSGDLQDVLLNINIDGAGFLESRTAYSLYNCPEWIEKSIREVFSSRDGFLEGEAWYQSDHMVFVQQGVPALALTTASFSDVWSSIAHTAQDTIEIVNPAILVQIAAALKETLGKLKPILARE
jgi:aminopeptidase YwaD